jgi:flavodoxin
MKILIIYYTMGGRTKKTAEAIGSALIDHEVKYFPIELRGKRIEKIKQFDKFQKGDYSELEEDLNSLDIESFELLIIGMPTYGKFPPKTFDEVIRRMGDLSNKKVIVFTTARFSGGKARDYMESKLENSGGRVIEKLKFRKLFWIGTKSALKYGKVLNTAVKDII